MRALLQALDRQYGRWDEVFGERRVLAAALPEPGTSATVSGGSDALWCSNAEGLPLDLPLKADSSFLARAINPPGSARRDLAVSAEHRVGTSRPAMPCTRAALRILELLSRGGGRSCETLHCRSKRRRSIPSINRDPSIRTTNSSAATSSRSPKCATTGERLAARLKHPY